MKATFGHGLVRARQAVHLSAVTAITTDNHRHQLTPHNTANNTPASSSLHSACITMSAHASSAPPPPPQWVVELNSAPSSRPPQKSSIPDPPGYTASLTRKERAISSKQSVRKAPSPEEMDTLKMKKAWEVAIAPVKQLPMNAIGATPALPFRLPH